MKYKVGDKIKLTQEAIETYNETQKMLGMFMLFEDNYGVFPKNATATIVRIDDEEDILVTVDGDFVGHGENNKQWYIIEKAIECVLEPETNTSNVKKDDGFLFEIKVFDNYVEIIDEDGNIDKVEPSEKDMYKIKMLHEIYKMAFMLDN